MDQISGHIIDTNNILCRHQQYFDNLCSLENVYSYGFSYNKIDKIYIEEIIKKHTNSNTNWHLNLYQQGEYEEQYNVLEDLGFIGKIIPLD